MSIFTKLRELSGRAILWQRFATGFSALAVAGVLAVGFSGGPARVAADGCNPNDIMPCGFTSADDFISKVNTNSTGDLGQVYAHFGLSSVDGFKNAVTGLAKQDGTVLDDKGNVVMTDAWSIGRSGFSYSTPYTPLSSVGTFFKSSNTDVLLQDLPVMIMFDKEGTAQFVAIKSCGNPINAERVKSGAECKDLVKKPVDGKKNTYQFTTNATKFGLAQFIKFDYFVDEGNGPQLFATTDSPDKPVERTFTKDATVSVRITISVPGNQTREIVSEACTAEVTVQKKVTPPTPPEKVVKVNVVTPPTLPVTGPAGLAGLFTGVSATGAAGHHLYRAYRSRKRR